MKVFFGVCEKINCPISHEKTEGPLEIITFLGTLLNGRSLTLSIPSDKVKKAYDLLHQAIDNEKVKIKCVQQLTGTLNFLNRVIVPRRAFTQGMYEKLKTTNAKGKQLLAHHHVYLNAQFIQDCWVWVEFLKLARVNNRAVCRPFIDFAPNSTHSEV